MGRAKRKMEQSEKNKKFQKAKKVQLKKNNFEETANAQQRAKIFGSRYLDRNSKKDVFKLPRELIGTAKRKDPILENMQPRKKRKISEFASLNDKLAYNKRQSEESKRMRMIHAVNAEWPTNEIQKLDRTRASRDNL